MFIWRLGQADVFMIPLWRFEHQLCKISPSKSIKMYAKKYIHKNVSRLLCLFGIFYIFLILTLQNIYSCLIFKTNRVLFFIF